MGELSKSLLIRFCLAKYCTWIPHSSLTNPRQIILTGTSSFLYSLMEIWCFILYLCHLLEELILSPWHSGNHSWSLLKLDTCTSKMRTNQPTSTTLPRKIQAQKNLSTTWLGLIMMGSSEYTDDVKNRPQRMEKNDKILIQWWICQY